MNKDVLSDIQGATRGAPSRIKFRRVRAILDNCPSRLDEMSARRAASRAMSGWPDRFRRVHGDLGMVESALAGSSAPLVRHLFVDFAISEDARVFSILVEKHKFAQS